ncbi:MAG: ATP-binding protein [Pseudomonadales bacterium]|nr:ATP-binding protein [Pseudomonadales bacterium]
MSIEPAALILMAGLYLSCIFGLAYATEKNLLPERLIKHPVIYVLSLGIAINTWSFYTSIGAASVRGYGYLAYYMGYSAAFIFAPVFLEPILHITRTYQLSSMADLFAFRFRSPWAGTLTTIVLLLCIIPLITLQMLAVGQSFAILAPGTDVHLLTLAFCVVITLFTVMFGGSDKSGRDKHEGIVVAIAFESVFKLSILIGLGLYAIYVVFGGFGSLDQWLLEQASGVTRLDEPFMANSTNLVILLFFTAAIAMPYMFHMVFRENSNPENLKIASWGFPLLLLLASLPALPVLWSSIYLDSDIAVEYSVLAITLFKGSNLGTILVFTGGVAAAFGITAISTMALSNMCLNHLILPVQKPDTRVNLYRWLLLRRRLLITAIILVSYFSFLLAEGSNITDVGYISFIACVQFLPGIISLLYWPIANGKGFVAGLLAGVTVWFMLGLIPMFTRLAIFPIGFNPATGIDWNLVASLSLVTNMLVLLLVSRLSTTCEEERAAAEMCAMNTLRRPRRLGLIVKTPREFIDRLSVSLGKATAKREVLQALKDLGIDENETRPYTIQQLRGQIEANLSGLLGPTISHQIIDRFLPYEMISEHASLDISFIESRLEAYPGNLSGVAADLDNLRRYHRQILQNLPMGVCSIGNNSEISLWNGAMEKLTEVPSSFIVGAYPTSLPQPWKSLFLAFIEDNDSTHVYKKSITLGGRQRWVSLHKAAIEKPHGITTLNDGLVLVAEDLTETELLEAELTHSERLASIGRLAAGVAHEIGNPITGIACLAQNIRDETHDSELRLMAQQIIEQTQRTSRIVQSLVGFSHSGPNRRGDQEFMSPVSILECTEEAIQLISLNQKSKDIRYQNHCSSMVQVFTDKQRLQQIFVNLLTNARDASRPGDSVSVTDSINNDRISIIISDQGEGIPVEIQDRIFEPFFTTKEPGKGTGLGLSLVYSITEDLGGSIRIESPTDRVSKRGTRVIVTFPCYDAGHLDNAKIG